VDAIDERVDGAPESGRVLDLARGPGSHDRTVVNRSARMADEPATQIRFVFGIRSWF
jgi:hypothetical protein